MPANSGHTSREQALDAPPGVQGQAIAVPEIQLERAMRFELTTLTLARLCSTPELRPRPLDGGEI